MKQLPIYKSYYRRFHEFKTTRINFITYTKYDALIAKLPINKNKKF